MHRHGLAVMLAAAAWGVGIVLFGLSDTLWLALLCLVFAGAADMISGIFRGDHLEPDHPRPPARPAGRHRDALLHDRPDARPDPRRADRPLVGLGGSVVWGGVLCVAGTGALAAALPAFLRYDGRDGLAHKDAEEAARAIAVGATT